MKRTPLRKRRKTRKGQIPESVLDALWSKRIRERDLVCRYGSYNYLDCAGHLEAAHMYSRTYRNIRWDLGNGNLLCTAHHFLLHRNPVHAGRVYELLWGRDHLDSLWIKAQAVGKVDRAAVKAYLLGAS